MQTSELPLDPLSSVLALLRPRSYVSGGFDVGGAWSVRFGNHDGIKCYALVSGQCWLVVEGVEEPVRLTAGDCFLLPKGRPFCLTSDLALEPMDACHLFGLPLKGNIAVWNGGGDCFGVGGHFALSGDASILLGVLPPIVHLRSESDRAAMRWSLERMMQELRHPQPGGALIAQQLATLMLVQALRLHLADAAQGGVGWLFALADKQMSAALAVIHNRPGHHWTLQSLAEQAGMSRSTFALRFKQTVGVAPLDYLTRWRMLVAADRLTATSDSITDVALALGYDSESAFSAAFKRVMGRSPRQYSRARRLPPVSVPPQDTNAHIAEAVSAL